MLGLSYILFLSFSHYFLLFYIDNSLDNLYIFKSTVDFFTTTSANLCVTNSLFCKPTIIPFLPDNIRSTAFAPRRLPRTRSFAVGEPPRCKCPKTVTRSEERRVGTEC